jgi:hypothetical protein
VPLPGAPAPMLALGQLWKRNTWRLDPVYRNHGVLTCGYQAEWVPNKSHRLALSGVDGIYT